MASPGQLEVVSVLPAFTAGLISVLTPCVYPLIPITLSVVGLTGASSLFERIRNAVAYILGIVITYTTLGMIAAKTGAIFGAFLTSRWVLISFGVFYWILALATLEVFQIGAFNKVQQRASKIGGRGWIGALLMGLVSGFVAAPCVGPALVAILGFAANSQDVIYGGVIMASYALGFGTPFLLLAIFASASQRLPRSGNWLLWIKFIMATLLFGAGLAFAAPALPLPQLSLAIVVALFTAGGLLAIKDKTRIAASAIIGIALAFTYLQHANFTAASGVDSAQGTKPNWLGSIDEAIRLAKENRKPIMLDFYAEWCGACKEFEHITFPDKTVANTLGGFNLARFDMTFEGAEVDAMTERFQLVGLPWITFLNPDGEIMSGKEVSGFLKPTDFNAHLLSVLSAAQDK